MKKNVKRTLVMMMAILTVSANLTAFASSVPKKTESTGASDKYSSDTQKVVQTVNENKEEKKETAKATKTPEASPKATTKTTPKATTKATSKTIDQTVEPDEEDDEVKKTEEAKEEDVIVVGEEAPKPELNVVTNPESINGKRYLTKGGAFWVFILTVLVSAILSFLISYRFYKMTRTDSHIMAEIRALKRDIDTKMSGSVGGFSEYETKTTNSNPSYAREGRPIRRNTESSSNQNTSDMYSKWERQINSTSNSPADEPVRRAERNIDRSRYSRAKKQKSAAAKIKDVFDDFFSKRK